MNNSSLFSADVDAFNRVIQSTGNNVSLKIGVVIDSYDIDNDKNVSKSVKEYDVLVGEQNGNAPVTPHIYRNCRQMEMFGSQADFMEYTYRKNQKDFEGPSPEEEGSLVLILCNNGNSTDAIVIGSVRHSGRSTTLTKKAGHHLEGEFNGVNWEIDKDGALTVRYKSATDNKGTPQDIEAGGSVFKIEKDGSVELNDGPIPEVDEDGNEIPPEDSGDSIAYEKFRMDKTAKTIDLESREDQSYKTDKNFNFEAKESMNIKLGKDLIAEAEGKAAFTVSQAFDVEAKGPASFKSQNLQVESKSLIQMKAQSLFQVEAGSNAIIKAPQLLLGPSPAQPALLAYELITLAVGNLGAPTIGSAIAGYSTSIIISS